MSLADYTKPNPERADRPWAVVGVSDGTRSAFGYTNGLTALYEHPELWMGDLAANDPLALQWCAYDIGYWLNRLAGMVRDADPFSPGDVVEAEEPGFNLLLEFTMGEPVNKYAVDALLVEPTALVLPVHWTATWRGDPPAWLPRTTDGGVHCPCDPPECLECARETRAARRARRRHHH